MDKFGNINHKTDKHSLMMYFEKLDIDDLFKNNNQSNLNEQIESNKILNLDLLNQQIEIESKEIKSNEIYFIQQMTNINKINKLYELIP